MTPFIIIIILLMAAIAVLTTILCQPVYREEDHRASYDRQVDIFSKSRRLIIADWILLGIWVVLLFIVRMHQSAVIAVGAICLINMAFWGYYAYTRRGDYYIVSQKGLTSISNNRVEWSHTWEEIDHINRRVVSAGKTIIIYLDVYCKDGTVHKSLPNSMKRTISQYIHIERHPTNWRVFRIVMAIIALLFLTVIMFNMMG